MVETTELTYEEKVERLDEILQRLDHAETPIDKLAEDVAEGARLIRDLEQKLKQVELAVHNVFRELENA
jgi:exodeoxyribonuclease VII small subunit